MPYFLKVPASSLNLFFFPAGVSTSHRSTEELLRLADAQIKARKGTPSVGGSLSGLPSQGKSQKAFQVSSVGGGGGTTAMSYDASRKTRSSTEVSSL